ncbi:MAG: hypothetical protein AAFS03_07680 [Pseudomonadota bacterium]
MTRELAIAIVELSRRLAVDPRSVVPLALRDFEAAPDIELKVWEITSYWPDAEMLAGRAYPLHAVRELIPFIAVIRLAENAGIGRTLH